MRLSCHAFGANAVRLRLFTLAYNLADVLRPLALPDEVPQWTLTTPRAKLIKIGAWIVRHGRCVVFRLAEVASRGRCFAAILRRIDRRRRGPAPAGDVTGHSGATAGAGGAVRRRLTSSTGVAQRRP